jgi:hypothetical protein
VRAWLAALLLTAPACQAPALPGSDPWSDLRRGSVGLVARQPLLSTYRVDGDFEVGIPSVGFAPLVDASDVEAVYGVVLGATAFLSERWIVSTALDLRDYDVEELQPLDPLQVELDGFRTLQLETSLTYLFDPFEGAPRLRPYARGSLLLYPRTDVAGLALVSEITPGNSDVRFDGRMGGYAAAGLGVGLLYRWSERGIAECGLVYEHALTRPDFEIQVDAFGTGDPDDFLVSTGEVEPAGWVLHVGFTWLF